MKCNLKKRKKWKCWKQMKMLINKNEKKNVIIMLMKHWKKHVIILLINSNFDEHFETKNVIKQKKWIVWKQKSNGINKKKKWKQWNKWNVIKKKEMNILKTKWIVIKTKKEMNVLKTNEM